MKRLLPLLSPLLLLCASVAHAQSMGQPGFYGRIEIGTAQQPPLLISDAVMGNPGVYTGQPVYMHVPPAHAYAWSRYCNLYGACDWMVYFVDNDWYDTVYVPGFRSGIYTYAPPPVYVAPPVYIPRPYYYGPPPHHHHPPPPAYVRPPPYPGAPGWHAQPPPGPNHHDHPPRHDQPSGNNRPPPGPRPPGR
jgi:hypothetical protein